MPVGQVKAFGHGLVDASDVEIAEDFVKFINSSLARAKSMRISRSSRRVLPLPRMERTVARSR
jgi:hypothetical protein